MLLSIDRSRIKSAHTYPCSIDGRGVLLGKVDAAHALVVKKGDAHGLTDVGNPAVRDRPALVAPKYVEPFLLGGRTTR